RRFEPMASRPQRRYSLDDYFAVEASSAIRHEYTNGEIFAMAGASVAHNHIAANVLTHLRTALRGTPCSAFGSDLRLATPGGLYMLSYPGRSRGGPPRRRWRWDRRYRGHSGSIR